MRGPRAGSEEACGEGPNLASAESLLRAKLAWLLARVAQLFNGGGGGVNIALLQVGGRRWAGREGRGPGRDCTRVIAPRSRRHLPPGREARAPGAGARARGHLTAAAAAAVATP